MPVKAAVFDIGNVLLRWDPETYYDQKFGEARRQAFFEAVPIDQVNERSDNGEDSSSGDVPEDHLACGGTGRSEPSSPVVDVEAEDLGDEGVDQVIGPCDTVEEVFTSTGSLVYRYKHLCMEREFAEFDFACYGESNCNPVYPKSSMNTCLPQEDAKLLDLHVSSHQ